MWLIWFIIFVGLIVIYKSVGNDKGHNITGNSDKQSSMKPILNGIEEAKEFSEKYGWFLNKNIGVIKEADSSGFTKVYVCMSVDSDCPINKYEIEQKLKENEATDWDVLEDSSGKLFLRRLVSFGNVDVKVIKSMINEKYPQYYVMTNISSSHILNVSWR